MAVNRVIVRMYKGLLGDCFLIRIEEAFTNRYILIDCGILQGLENATERMKVIAEDIAKTTSKRLDLLVVTHEHWDHISGFSQARDIFLDPAKLTIDRLWMAWTEKPGDDQADRLRARFDKRKLALTALANAFAPREDPPAAGAEAPDHAQASDDTPANNGTPARAGKPSPKDVLRQLADFIGPVEKAGSSLPPGTDLGMVPTGRLTGRLIMQELQDKAKGVDYLEPGQVIPTPGDEPLRVAVLGPPRKEERLFKDRPSGGDAKETYLAEQMLMDSLLGLAGDKGETLGPNTQSPFSFRHHQGLAADTVKGIGAPATASSDPPPAKPHPDAEWLHDRYFADTERAPGYRANKRPKQDYRRIDDLGDGTAGLALKLDSDTNNTSLVLAFELPDKSFMLFAADAQVGNWLSWHDQDYPFGDKPCSAEHILNNTRLYKVGHHGSHNATLRGKGLEMMTHADLVAMVSTVSAAAERQPSGWEMPDEDVEKALEESCKGRVLYGDRVWPNQRGGGATPAPHIALLKPPSPRPIFTSTTRSTARMCTERKSDDQRLRPRQRPHLCGARPARFPAQPRCCRNA
jgi:glyoxylase-like metal-dependent hydrolase (beta-lactamase superfamily II)